MFQISSSKVPLLNQEVPIVDRVDVLVCGGGVAGIAAAVAAARTGARTLLLERAGFLGGTATGAAMGLLARNSRASCRLPSGREARVARRSPRSVAK